MKALEVFDRTIDVLIMRLRRKIQLNPHQPTLIKTLRGLGYVFSADVTRQRRKKWRRAGLLPTRCLILFGAGSLLFLLK